MITWTIANLERNTEDGGVVTIHWRVTEVDGEYSASSYGTVGLEPDASAEGFVAFEDLDEATVLGWVKDAVNATEIESNLSANIAAQKAPATMSGLPW